MIHTFNSLSTSIQIGACFFGSIVVVAAILSAIDAYLTWYHTYRMSIHDEFEDNYDPYADAAPSWNSIDRVRTVLFQDIKSMHSWICTNVPNEHRKIQLYLNAIIAKENTGIYRFTVELSSKEILEVL